MTSTLQVQLLGRFQLQFENVLLTDISSPRLQSLLAYLLLNAGTPLSRRQIAFQLWPDSSDSQARGNLRRELSTLRRKLPDAEQFLQMNGQVVQWNPDAPCTIDVIEFEHHLANAKDVAGTTEERSALQKAVELYQGALFPDCYDEWIWAERDQLEQDFSQALDRLIRLLEDGRNYTEAIGQAQRLLRHDPLSEPTYRTLMRLHALNDDRAGALRVYHSCTTMLERELDVPPEPETEALYRQIMRGDRRDDVAEEAPRQRTIQSTLVGRDQEWNQLRSLWEQAQKGSAHFVLISGEAGMGKSQLSEEFERWVGRQGGAVATTRVYEMEGGLAYTPVIDWSRSDLLRPVVAKMEDVWLVELARLLPELLSERPDLPHPQPLTDSRQRQRLFESLNRVLQMVDEPLLLLLDDMHWCDQETVAWLQYLFSVWADAPLLLVATVRPGEISEAHPAQALWRELRIQQRFSEIALQPLSKAETIALANQVAGEQMEAETIARLYAESEGVPFFLVEMVRAHLWDLHGENEPTPSSTIRPLEVQDSSLPPQIQAVIEVRLGRLSEPTRRVAALAATIGRAFSYDLLVEASGEDEDTLVEGLDELWQRRIIREEGTFSYIFGHGKIREVAYDQLSTIRRRQLHRRVAGALERFHADELESISGQLAYHCERAGLIQDAISWHQRTADAAQRLYAHDEAITHFRSCLRLLDLLPEDATVIARRVEILLALDLNFRTGRGIVYTGREAILLQARTLAASLGDSQSLFHIYGLLSWWYSGQGRQFEALESAQNQLQVSEQKNDPEQNVTALMNIGRISMHMGDFVQARQPFGQSQNLIRANGIPAPNHFFPIVCWILGYPDKAQTIGRQEYYPDVELAARYAHGTAFFAAILYRKLQAKQLLAEQTKTMLALGDEFDIPLSRQSGMVFRGWELAHQGDLEAGIMLTKQGIDGFREMGHTMFATHRLAVLIEMHLMANQVDEAQVLLDEAFTLSREKGERFWDVELHRLQGDLLLASGDEAAAEDAYQQAIEVAQAQQAKSLELIAVLHLCRLWQSQGKQAEAHACLSEIYDWFNEGFDTGLLREANTLLAELAEH